MSHVFVVYDEDGVQVHGDESIPVLDVTMLDEDHQQDYALEDFVTLRDTAREVGADWIVTKADAVIEDFVADEAADAMHHRRPLPPEVVDMLARSLREALNSPATPETVAWAASHPELRDLYTRGVRAVLDLLGIEQEPGDG